MGYQAIFKRYEIKYLITARQKERILKAMKEHDGPLAEKLMREHIRQNYQYFK